MGSCAAVAIATARQAELQKTEDLLPCLMQALWCFDSNKHQQIQYCSFPEWPCAWTLEAPLNGQIARGLVLSLICCGLPLCRLAADDRGAAGGGGGSRPPGHPAYRWHLDRSHVRRPHFFLAFLHRLCAKARRTSLIAGKKTGSWLAAWTCAYHVWRLRDAYLFSTSKRVSIYMIKYTPYYIWSLKQLVTRKFI